MLLRTVGPDRVIKRSFPSHDVLTLTRDDKHYRHNLPTSPVEVDWSTGRTYVQTFSRDG